MHDKAQMRHDQLSCRFQILFIASRSRHTASLRDWSSEVCSSGLILQLLAATIGKEDGDGRLADCGRLLQNVTLPPIGLLLTRSEERRVGKESGQRCLPGPGQPRPDRSRNNYVRYARQSADAT